MSTHGPTDDPIGAPMTAAAFLDRLCALHEQASTSIDEPLELYHRHAATVRVGVTSGTEQPEVHVGREDGLALRVHAPTAGETTFAASSGHGPEVVGDLVSKVRGGYAHRGRFGEETPWQATEDRVADADPEMRLPSVAELTRWLEVARGSLPAREADTDVSARVEAAAIVETWVSSGGRRASRSRLLCWAAAEPPDATDWGGGPFVLSARSWNQLAADGWSGIAGDRVWPDKGRATVLPSKIPLFFSPEASATLVAALVSALHGPGGEPEVAVGPGWRVRDEPFAEGAVRGRAFDDACFDTRSRWLADGQSVVGLIGGPGNWLRESYRDVPLPLPTHLVVDPPPTSLPAAAILITGVRIHPLSPEDWVMEVRGGILDEGEPGPAVERGLLRIGPRDLASRCVAGLGPAQPSWRNTSTPALLFDGLSPALIP